MEFPLRLALPSRFPALDTPLPRISNRQTSEELEIAVTYRKQRLGPISNRQTYAFFPRYARCASLVLEESFLRFRTLGASRLTPVPTGTISTPGSGFPSVCRPRAASRRRIAKEPS